VNQETKTKERKTMNRRHPTQTLRGGKTAPAAAAALAATLTLGLTGCGSESEAKNTQPPTTTPTTTQTTTPTPTPTPTQDEQDAQAAANKVIEYNQLECELAMNPTTERFDEIVLIARGNAAEGTRNLILGYLEDGIHKTAVSEVEILEVNKTTATTWEVMACIDASGLDVVDEAGQSVALPDRQTRVLNWREVTLDTNNGNMYVTDIKNVFDGELQTC